MKYVFFVILFMFSCGPKYQQEFNRYIIYSTDEVSFAGLENQISQHGRIQKELRYHKGYVAYISPMDLPKIKGDNIRIEKDIVHLASGSCSQTPAPDFPEPDEQPVEKDYWGNIRIGADVARKSDEGADVKVCVIDTGIDAYHIEFSSTDKILACESFVETERSCQDYQSHGTHVAGIISADKNGVGLVGVAPKARLLIMKALDYRGSGFSSDIADAIHGCILNDADIINMSLGASEPSTIIHDAVKAASSKGIIVVAAAGNESGPVSFPGAFAETVGVASLAEGDKFSYFSNFGKEVDVIAPGSNIFSSIPNNNYAYYSGTSMASPMMAGVYALSISSGKAIKYEDLGFEAEKQGKGLPDLKAMFQ